MIRIAFAVFAQELGGEGVEARVSMKQISMFVPGGRQLAIYIPTQRPISEAGGTPDIQ